jgi:hypothetical protein
LPQRVLACASRVVRSGRPFQTRPSDNSDARHNLEKDKVPKRKRHMHRSSEPKGRDVDPHTTKAGGRAGAPSSTNINSPARPIVPCPFSLRFLLSSLVPNYTTPMHRKPDVGARCTGVPRKSSPKRTRIAVVSLLYSPSGCGGKSVARRRDGYAQSPDFRLVRSGSIPFLYGGSGGGNDSTGLTIRRDAVQETTKDEPRERERERF